MAKPAKGRGRDRYTYVKTPYIAASLLAQVVWDKDERAKSLDAWYNFYVEEVHAVARSEFEEALLDLVRLKYCVTFSDEFSPTFYKFYPAHIVSWPIYPLSSDNVLGKYVNLGSEWLKMVFSNIDSDDRFEIQEEAPRDAIPASDRLVSIDHNAPDSIEIAAGLDEAIIRFEQDNELRTERPDAHSRILSGLKAARELWNASSLQVLQLKVGVAMVLEEAEAVAHEKFYGAAISALLLIIKRFFKDKANIDLDQVF